MTGRVGWWLGIALGYSKLFFYFLSYTKRRNKIKRIWKGFWKSLCKKNGILSINSVKNSGLMLNLIKKSWTVSSKYVIWWFANLTKFGISKYLLLITLAPQNQFKTEKKRVCLVNVFCWTNNRFIFSVKKKRKQILVL